MMRGYWAEPGIGVADTFWSVTEGRYEAERKDRRDEYKENDEAAAWAGCYRHFAYLMWAG